MEPTYPHNYLSSTTFYDTTKCLYQIATYIDTISKASVLLLDPPIATLWLGELDFTVPNIKYVLILPKLGSFTAMGVF